MTKTIFIEIDGIISDTTHRQSMSTDFDTYEEMAEDDGIDYTIREIVTYLAESYDIVLFSLRRERHRHSTLDWLMSKEIPCDELYLRPDGDYTNANLLRSSFIIDHFNGDEEKALDQTLFVVVNKEPVVEDLRERGFKVLSSDWS